jgi:hypothetical protein
MLESNPLAAVRSVTGTTSANQDRDVVDEGGRARLSRRLLNGVAGGACPPPLRSCRQLWGCVAVDVLVEPAGPRARVSAEAAAWQRRPAL